MKKQIKNRLGAILTLLTALPFASLAQADDVDFSCMSYKVWSKSHVSNQYRSYDIVVQNDCPGAVYWAMCIERLDLNTHKVIETHNPTGYVDEGKKARVNLNLKQDMTQSRFRNRFQEFYVDIGYSIDGLPVARCYAKQCEAEKSALRSEISANEKAWKEAEKSFHAKISAECPDTGWDQETHDECVSNLMSDSDSRLEVFAATDQELREQMAAIDPDTCQVYSGELVP